MPRQSRKTSKTEIKHKGRIHLCWSCIFFICFSCILFSCGEKPKSSFKNLQIVWATNYSEDGLDFLLDKDTTYIYPDNKLVLKEGMHFYSLSSKEYSIAKDLLKKYFDYYLYDVDNYLDEEPYRLRKYFRQYLAYKKNDSIFVHVNLYTNFPKVSNPECLCELWPIRNVLIYKENGGRDYGTAIIDITNKRIIYFKLSKKDMNYKAGEYSEQELKVLLPSLFDNESHSHSL